MCIGLAERPHCVQWILHGPRNANCMEITASSSIFKGLRLEFTASWNGLLLKGNHSNHWQNQKLISVFTGTHKLKSIKARLLDFSWCPSLCAWYPFSGSKNTRFCGVFGVSLGEGSFDAWKSLNLLTAKMFDQKPSLLSEVSGLSNLSSSQNCCSSNPK